MNNAVTTTGGAGVLPQPQREEKLMKFIPFGSADEIKLSVAVIKSTVATPTKQGKLPTDRDCIRFMMLCQAQRLNPFAGDAYLIGYDGFNGPEFSLITSHQAMLKRAEVSDHFEGMTSGVILWNKESETIEEREGDFHLPSEVVVGGWAKVFHAKRKMPTYRRVRVERFNKGIAQWKVDPAGMIVKCAEADALRSTFPTMLGGLMTQQEAGVQVETPLMPSESQSMVEALTKPAPQPRIANVPAAAQEQKEEAPADDGAGGGEFDPVAALVAAIIASRIETNAFEAWLVKNRHIDGYEETPRTLEECVAQLTPGQAESLLAIVPEIVKACTPAPAEKVKKAATPKAATPPAEAPAAANVVNLPPPGENEPEPIKKCRAAMAAHEVTEAQLIAWGKHPRTKKLAEAVQTLADAFETNVAFINFCSLKMEVIKKEIVSLKL